MLNLIQHNIAMVFIVTFIISFTSLCQGQYRPGYGHGGFLPLESSSVGNALQGPPSSAWASSGVSHNYGAVKHQVLPPLSVSHYSASDGGHPGFASSSSSGSVRAYSTPFGSVTEYTARDRNTVQGSDGVVRSVERTASDRMNPASNNRLPSYPGVRETGHVNADDYHNYHPGSVSSGGQASRLPAERQEPTAAPAYYHPHHPGSTTVGSSSSASAVVDESGVSSRISNTVRGPDGHTRTVEKAVVGGPGTAASVTGTLTTNRQQRPQEAHNINSEGHIHPQDQRAGGTATPGTNVNYSGYSSEASASASSRAFTSSHPGQRQPNTASPETALPPARSSNWYTPAPSARPPPTRSNYQYNPAPTTVRPQTRSSHLYTPAPSARPPPTRRNHQYAPTRTAWTTRIPTTTVAPKVCDSSPWTKNIDYSAVRSCAGKWEGGTCEISCRTGFQPTKNYVRCIRTRQGKFQWDDMQVKCQRANRISCRNRHNKPVDWFVAYRLPVSEQKPRRTAEESYIFIADSGPENLNGPFYPQDFPLANTLRPLETANNARNSSVSYLLYSNEPPGGNVEKLRYGNSKGVIMHDGTDGFYLIHNKPRYPQGSNDLHMLEPGQLALCISFNKRESLPSIMNYVDSLASHEYQRVGVFLNPQQSRGSSDFIKHEIQSQSPALQLDMFTKSRSIDLYLDAIAANYRTKLQVFSWPLSSPKNDVASDCAQPRRIENILEIRDPLGTEIIRGDPSLHSRTREAMTDYANWAMDDGKKIFCLVDLGRSRNEFSKRGGAVCLKNDSVVRAFRSLIVLTECSL